MRDLLPLYQEEPSRFMRFYNAVYLKLLSIPEGGILRIADHCRKNVELFIKVANLLMIEEISHKKATDDLLEFSDDYTTIRRCYKFVPSRPYRAAKRGI